MIDSRLVCLLYYNFFLFRLCRYLIPRVLSIPLELFGLRAYFFRHVQVCNAGTESIQWSVRQGVGLKVKKPNILTCKEEQWMLKSKDEALDHSKGLNNRSFTSVAGTFFIRMSFARLVYISLSFTYLKAMKSSCSSHFFYSLFLIRVL